MLQNDITQFSHACTCKINNCFIDFGECSLEISFCHFFYLPIVACCFEICCSYWCNSNCWPVYSWHIYQSDPGCFSWTSPFGGHWSKSWSPAADWSFICKHSHHCLVQYRFSLALCGYCYSLQQQGRSSSTFMFFSKSTSSCGCAKKLSRHDIKFVFRF